MPQKRKFWLILGAAIFFLGWAALHYRMPALAYYWLSMHSQPESAQKAGLWLPAYTAVIDAHVIEGIEDNASGLTYNPHTGTLFTVINAPTQVAELTVEGSLLRLMPLTGARDPEGITHVNDDLFALADEREERIYYIRITPETRSIDLAKAPHLGLSLDFMDNLGFEGISWDYVGNRLFVTKEKAPLRVLEISGLSALLEGGPMRLQISEWKSSDAFTLLMTDLSSLTFHEDTGHMLLLSHESKLVVEYDSDGKPVSIMTLWQGRHGLAQSVPQAEGIAVDDKGNLFVLSEPNLFYRFKRNPPPDWIKPTAPTPN